MTTQEQQPDILDASTGERIIDLARRVSFQDWSLGVWAADPRTTAGDGAFCVWSFRGPDSETGVPTWQLGRVWYLDPSKPQWEWVGTAFAAAKMAVEHEVREHFRDNGVAIYSPHLGAPGRRTDG